ncbi:MAG: hypothetical protein ACXABO_18840 [Promethearchaeota archaeon]
MSIQVKLRDFSSIILTTSEEFHKLKGNFKRLKFLIYDEKDDFDNYILKVLAAYKINYKENYEELTFSVDPGSKRIGMVVFLDDYYLISHTYYNKEILIKSIKDYINCFENNNSNLLKLTFKFGRGVLPLTLDLIGTILNILQKRKNFKVYLVDEAKSSKIKIKDEKKKFRTKHELSALILALRGGLEVNQLNMFRFVNNSNQGKKLDLNNKIGEDKLINDIESGLEIKEIIDKILSNDFSLSKSAALISKYNNLC